MEATRTLMRRYSGLRALLSSIPATPSAPATPSRAAAVERAKQRLRTTLSANGLPKAPSRMGPEPGSASGSPRVAAGQSFTILLRIACASCRLLPDVMCPGRDVLGHLVGKQIQAGSAARMPVPGCQSRVHAQVSTGEAASQHA